MSKQIENKYDTAKKMYPILKNYPYSIIETLDKNSPYYLEHFPPEEVGSLENPRPKNLPIGEYGLQIFKDVRPEDIAGDIISHHIINKDKYLSKKYEEFKKLISKEDILNRYNYHKNNLGEKRDFNNWSERTGYPELLRGYVFNQFDKKTKNELFTLEQKKVLDSIKNYITQNEQTQQAFNQGGTTMEQQMSLFEEGGMKDDGMGVDPVSGNEVPPGSLAKEVRDDIPAQLSDGEYVVPADVVQYYGVKFFEDLRAEAKAGLAEMEATGRIGGEPMSMTMIAIGKAEKEKKKKAQGGIVYASDGVLTADQKAIDASQPKFNPQDWSVSGFTPGSPIYQTGQGQPQQNRTTMTYYNSQTGESKVVTFVNGIVTPTSDLQYTQPPWSINKPTQTQQEVTKDKDKDRNKTVDNIKKDGWGIDPDKYDFSTWDSDRFFKEAADQLKISMSEEVITAAATMANPLIGGVISQAATADGFVNTQVMINMLTAAGREEEASKIQEMYDTAFNSLGSIQKSMFESNLGQKFLSGGVTLVQSNASSNPSYKNFVKDTKPPIPPSGNNNNQGNNKPNITKDTSNYGTNIKELSDARKDRMEKDPNFIPKGVDADLVKKADATRTQVWKKEEDKFDRATPFASSKKNEFDDGTGAAMINKGGLATKTKSKPKTRKPRGKGLGNKK